MMGAGEVPKGRRTVVVVLKDGKRGKGRDNPLYLAVTPALGGQSQYKMIVWKDGVK